VNWIRGLWVHVYQSATYLDIVDKIIRLTIREFDSTQGEVDHRGISLLNKVVLCEPLDVKDQIWGQGSEMMTLECRAKFLLISGSSSLHHVDLPESFCHQIWREQSKVGLEE
jgi:hypothetical protein